MNGRNSLFSICGILCFFASVSLSANEASVSTACLKFSALPAQMLRDRGLPVRAKLRFIPVGSASYLIQDDASCGLVGRCDSDFFVSNEKDCFRNALSIHAKWMGSEGKVGRAPDKLRFQGDPEVGLMQFRYDVKTGDYQLEDKKEGGK